VLGRREVVGPAAVATLVLTLALITLMPRFAVSGRDPIVFVRYDGWFSLYIASRLPDVSPDAADIPAYRAQRILMPALVAVVLAAAGHHPDQSLPRDSSLLPGLWAILAVNLAAMAAGSAALAALAVRHRLHPLFGSLFGLWIGSVYVLLMGMTDVLAGALVLWSLLCWERRALVACGALLGLAALAKETSLLFTVSFLVAARLGPRPGLRRFALLSLGPPVAWQLYLAQTFGLTGFQAALTPGHPGAGMLPLVGYFATPLSLMWALQGIWVLLPALVSLALGLCILRRSPLQPAGWALALNGPFVASLPAASTDYLGWSARIGLSVVVALAWALVRAERPRLTYTLAVFLLVPTALFVLSGGDFGPLSSGGIEKTLPKPWW
jgi:hypothetical protein